jgi:AcrR family transcriptional regulator
MADQSMNKTAVVSRKRGRPADTDSTDTRDRIVVCARERFAAEGFEGTTNREIAETAEVSSAALYHYFPSKADIYIAVCESITEIFVDVFARVGALGASAPSTVGFITGISAVVQKHPEVSKGTDVFGKEFARNIVDLIATAEETDRILQGTTVQSFADLVSSVLAGLGRMSARGDQSRHVAVAAAFLRLIHTAAQK